MIPFNRAVIGDAEIFAVTDAMRRRQIVGNGPSGRRVEQILEEIFGVARTLLTTSCTHALEMTARLANIEPGDEVIVPSYTFVSTANAYALAGARLVFADVSPQTLNVTPETVEPLISDKTKAICIVHYAGVGAQPDEFAEMCNQRSITLIEDNAHGLFGSYKSQALGTFGQMSTLSFHETKNISCGEGGALVINNPDLIDRAEIIREKGTNRTKFLRGIVDKYTWVDEGSSWVISDVLAALLGAQLDNSKVTQERRINAWTRYQGELSAWASRNDVRLPFVPTECIQPAHMFYLRFRSKLVRDSFIAHMRELNISVVFHYQALNASPFAAKFGALRGQCPEAEAASDDLVRLPMFGDISDYEIDAVVEACCAFAQF